jgi:hypothetical protein
MTTTQSPSEIIANLPVRQRPTLTIRGGLLLDLDPEYGDAIIGSVQHDAEGAYLGCSDCRAEIEESDGGLCPACRSDRAYDDIARL